MEWKFVQKDFQSSLFKRQFLKMTAFLLIADAIDLPLSRLKSTLDWEHLSRISFKGQDRITDECVVPYSPHLTLKFECHVNVEVCSSIKAFKYLYKYIYKGTDSAMLRLDNAQNQVRILSLMLHYILNLITVKLWWNQSVCKCPLFVSSRSSLAHIWIQNAK